MSPTPIQTDEQAAPTGVISQPDSHPSTGEPVSQEETQVLNGKGGAAPVFVDVSGRRRSWIRVLFYALGGVAMLYALLIGASLIGVVLFGTIAGGTLPLVLHADGLAS